MVNKINDVQKLFNEKIDYKETDEIINLEKEKTRQYLVKNLK